MFWEFLRFHHQYCYLPCYILRFKFEYFYLITNFYRQLLLCDKGNSYFGGGFWSSACGPLPWNLTKLASIFLYIYSNAALSLIIILFNVICFMAGRYVEDGTLMNYYVHILELITRLRQVNCKPSQNMNYTGIYDTFSMRLNHFHLGQNQF